MNASARRFLQVGAQTSRIIGFVMKCAELSMLQKIVIKPITV